MTAEQVFRRLVDTLDRAGIPYMLTGSFASAFHGVPRATQDIDMVIAPTADQLRALLGFLPAAEYDVDQDAALDAHRRHLAGRWFFRCFLFPRGLAIPQRASHSAPAARGPRAPSTACPGAQMPGRPERGKPRAGRAAEAS